MSVHKHTYYQVLGLEPAVSSLEIKLAYRTLVKSVHPDIGHKKLTPHQIENATQQTAKLNEAYETLKDKSKRAAYDSLIGVNGKGKVVKLSLENSLEQREQYLAKVFYPARQRINRILSKYKKQLAELSQDIYDQNLVDEFERYIDEVESTLLVASQSMTRQAAPSSLSAAELMMRYSIAQAADGLEELRYFCGNYDYNHLSMADNLFKESSNLSKQAFSLTRS